MDLNEKDKVIENVVARIREKLISLHGSDTRSYPATYRDLQKEVEDLGIYFPAIEKRIHKYYKTYGHVFFSKRGLLAHEEKSGQEEPKQEIQKEGQTDLPAEPAVIQSGQLRLSGQDSLLDQAVEKLRAYLESLYGSDLSRYPSTYRELKMQCYSLDLSFSSLDNRIRKFYKMYPPAYFRAVGLLAPEQDKEAERPMPETEPESTKTKISLEELFGNIEIEPEIVIPIVMQEEPKEEIEEEPVAIVEEAKQEEAAPVPLSVLNLGIRASLCLQKNGIETIEQLRGKKLENLLEIPFMTEGAAQEILARYQVYIGEPVTIPEESVVPEPITVLEESITSTPVSNLNLSVRPSNCLLSAKITTIEELSKYTDDELLRIPNMGVTSVTEIKTKLQQYLGHSNSNNTNQPDEEMVTGPIDLEAYDVDPEISVDILNLSVRAKNCLFRARITTIGELVKQTDEELLQIRNMGVGSVKEIRQKLQEYLKQPVPETKEPEESVQTTESPDEIMISREIHDAAQGAIVPGYAVVNGMIVNLGTKGVIPDAPVGVLDLSVRATNGLDRAEIHSLYELVPRTFQELRSIRNMGVGSVNEIQQKLDAYLRKNESKEAASVEYRISQVDVKLYFNQRPFKLISKEALAQAFPEAEADLLSGYLSALVDEGFLQEENNRYSLRTRSFFDLINGNDADFCLIERNIEILQKRSQGYTLEEVGAEYGVSRERIRQMEGKSFRRFHRFQESSGLTVTEDQYRYFYTEYGFTKELYADYLRIPQKTVYYLDNTYDKGSRNLEEALDDENLPRELRKCVFTYLHRNDVEIDGVHISATRGAVEDYVLEKYCRDEVTLEEFFKLYERTLADNDITAETLLLTESVKRTRGNRLAEADHLLWKQNQRLRYYNILAWDYTELLETLDLGKYQNVEISSRKLFLAYPELMKEYDLRDEYELHNLLKKIHAETENESLSLKRMPTMTFGQFDRDQAVKEMLFAMAPVSQDDLAKALSAEYGGAPATIKANWLTGIDLYYRNGMYSVAYQEMPKEQLEMMRKILTEDFYYLDEIRNLYRKAIPNGDETLISSFNLKRLGFQVFSQYVLKNYPTAQAYFQHLLTDEDVVDISGISKRFTGLTSYSGYLAGLRQQYEIIEFAPYQYINIRRLEKLGYGKEQLQAYCDRVWSSLTDEDYFSIQSLRGNGFQDELDALGFDDLFYASLLKPDTRFTWQRVGNAVVFNPKCVPFSVHDFLVDHVRKHGAIDIDQCVEELRTTYGIDFDRWDISAKVKGSSVYYDPIMEKLYADYALYLEEIEEN